MRDCRAGTRTPTPRSRDWCAANYTTRQRAAASIARCRPSGLGAQDAADDVEVDRFEALGNLHADGPREVEELEVQQGRAGSRGPITDAVDAQAAVEPDGDLGLAVLLGRRERADASHHGRGLVRELLDGL